MVFRPSFSRFLNLCVITRVDSIPFGVVFISVFPSCLISLYTKVRSGPVPDYGFYLSDKNIWISFSGYVFLFRLYVPLSSVYFLFTLYLFTLYTFITTIFIQ